MAITKERLDELIKEGATVYSLDKQVKYPIPIIFRIPVNKLKSSFVAVPILLKVRITSLRELTIMIIITIPVAITKNLLYSGLVTFNIKAVIAPKIPNPIIFISIL